MGPILLDTVNFASDSARFNEKDTSAFEALKGLAGPGHSAQALFDKLQEEKFNVASLSSRDLLRKDYKEFNLTIQGCAEIYFILHIYLLFPILNNKYVRILLDCRRTACGQAGDQLRGSVHRGLGREGIGHSRGAGQVVRRTGARPADR
jgi:hypothetical protein